MCKFSKVSVLYINTWVKISFTWYRTQLPISPILASNRCIFGTKQPSYQQSQFKKALNWRKARLYYVQQGESYREDGTNQSMIIGWESCRARARIWSRWSQSLMGSISIELGLDKSGQRACTVHFLLLTILFFHFLSFQSDPKYPEFFGENKLLPLFQSCCCWYLW